MSGKLKSQAKKALFQFFVNCAHLSLIMVSENPTSERVVSHEKEIYTILCISNWTELITNYFARGVFFPRGKFQEVHGSAICQSRSIDQCGPRLLTGFLRDH